jgi:hypothetical protein
MVVPGMQCVTRDGSARAAIGFCAVMALAPAGAALPAPAPATSVQTGLPVAAVWKERRLDFVYMGRTARYSCEGLRDKVSALLLELGARRDLKISTTGCNDFGHLRIDAGIPSLNIIFSAPALPDPAAKPLHGGDLAATDARFVPFTITGDAFRNMDIGDCELVDDFTRQILPKLTARDLQHDIACLPYQLSGSHFLVHGQILKAVPPAEHAAGAPPITDP